MALLAWLNKKKPRIVSGPGTAVPIGDAYDDGQGVEFMVDDVSGELVSDDVSGELVISDGA